MRLFIPAVGDRIRLVSDWTFKLYPERRNENFALARDPSLKNVTFDYGWRMGPPFDMLLPANTILECSRVYIRSTSKQAITAEESYDSLTWMVVEDGKALTKQRFWVKLIEANNIDCEIESYYRDRK